jgi:hypothetical protein
VPVAEPEVSYLQSACSRLHELLSDDLVGVYAGGSYALGDYRREASDLDLAAVVSAPLSDERRQGLVARLRHESLPCPARGLELVVYRRETALSGSVAADFELNLNSGSRMPVRVESRAAPGETHWFAIDRSILAQAGIALLGPPAGEAFAPITPRALAPILVDSIRWHRAHPEHGADAVLNACRSIRFAAEDRWSSKTAAGRWAVRRGLAPSALVDRACAARQPRPPKPSADPAPAPEPEEVERFLTSAEGRLRADGPAGSRGQRGHPGV